MNPNKTLFIEIDKHLMEDETPSLFLTHCFEDETNHKFPFTMLLKLKQTKQSPKHHPEGSVWNHTLLVVDEAAKVKNQSRDPNAFMWAALLHDIGKAETTATKNGRITSYDHDKVGAELTEKFLTQFTDNTEWIQKVTSLIRWHMQILFVVNNLPFADIKKMNKQTDRKEIALLGFCDRLGRLHVDRAKEQQNIERFLEKTREKTTSVQ